MRQIGWAFLVLALLFSPIAFAQSNPPAPSPTIAHQEQQTDPVQPQNPPEEYKIGTEQSPVIVKLLPALVDPDYAAQAKQEAKAHASNEWWLVALTGALAVATLLLVGVTAGLWWATQKILREASETSRAQLRAYVSLTQTNFAESGDHRNVHVSVQMMNAGQTPAHDVEQWINMGVWHLPLDRDFFPPNAIHFENTSKASLGPGATANLGVMSPNLPEGIILDTLTNAVLMIWGEIFYKDIFKDRHSYRFKARVVKGTNGVWGWEPTADNNFSD